MITVKDLKELLDNYEEDRVVIMSSDSEGNSYSPFGAIYTGAYRADSSFSGDIGIDELTESDIQAGYTEEDVIDGIKAIIFTPIR